MKQIPLALALSAVTTFAGAEDRNETILKTLYSKLERTLGASDPSQPVQYSGLVMASPGYVLDPSTDFNTQAGRTQIYDLVDHSIQSNWMLRFTSNRTSLIYKRILDNKEAAPSALTQDEKSKLAAAKSLLYSNLTDATPSTKYAKFISLQNAYYAAQDSYVTEVNASPAHQATNAQSAALTNAYNAYFNYPYYGDIVGAIDDEATYSMRIPDVYWGTLRNLYTRNLVPSGTGAGNFIAQYSFYPSFPAWMNNSLHWTTISISDADVNTIKTSSHTSWGGGLSAGWGLWRVGGSYGESTGTSLSSLDAQHFTVTFDVLRVLISRPWMDPAVYGSKSWRWAQSPNVPSDLISSGNMGDTAPSGTEPLVSQEILLAKNIRLHGDWTTDLATTYHSERSGGGSIGWGPFSFGGGGSSVYDESRDHNQVSSNDITSPDVQIIGLLVNVMPKTPDGDPNLFNQPVFPKVPDAVFKNPKIKDQVYKDAYQKLILINQ